MRGRIYNLLKDHGVYKGFMRNMEFVACRFTGLIEFVGPLGFVVFIGFIG